MKLTAAAENPNGRPLAMLHLNLDMDSDFCTIGVLINNMYAKTLRYTRNGPKRAEINVPTGPLLIEFDVEAGKITRFEASLRYMWYISDIEGTVTKVVDDEVHGLLGVDNVAVYPPDNKYTSRLHGYFARRRK